MEEPVPRLQGEEMELSDLVIKAQNGDDEAFSLICRRFAGLVKKHAFQAHLRPLYEDAQAEAWLAVAEAVRTYDRTTGVRFAGYVESKVRYALWNLFKRERRRWQREVLIADDEDDETLGGELDIPDADTDIAAAVEEKCLQEEVGRAIARLPERQRRAVELTVLEGYRQGEAARLLGVTAQAVHNLQKRGLARLKKDWAGMYEGERG